MENSFTIYSVAKFPFHSVHMDVPIVLNCVIFYFVVISLLDYGGGTVDTKKSTLMTSSLVDVIRKI